MNTDHKLPSAVIVGPTGSVFVSRTAEALAANGIQVSVLDAQQGETEATGRLGKLLLRVRQVWNTIKLMCTMDRNSTAIIMSLTVHSAWLAPLLKCYFRRVTGIAFGSDILRRNTRFDGFLAFGLNKLDTLCATNDNVLQEILSIVRPACLKRATIIRFGLPVFDELKELIADNISKEESKRVLGFATDRHLISLGYNATVGQRQIELLEAVESRIEEFSGYDFVVPVQYGEKPVIEAVKKVCSRLNKISGRQQFIPLTTFYDPVSSAHFRRATSAMINHSVSDAFSGSVQETIYAGNLVLAASHLPYENMPGFGTAIRNYVDLDEAFNALILENLSKWQKKAATHEVDNRQSLHQTSSWEAVMPAWMGLVQGEV
jgi:hypothetical protein